MEYGSPSIGITVTSNFAYFGSKLSFFLLTLVKGLFDKLSLLVDSRAFLSDELFCRDTASLLTFYKFKSRVFLVKGSILEANPIRLKSLSVFKLFIYQIKSIIYTL